MPRTVSPSDDGECYRLARTLRKVLISLKPRLANLSKALGAIRIALKRVEVQRSIPWTSTEHVEEGRVDNKQCHVEDLSQHLRCTCSILMAPCAENPMLSGKSPRASKGF